MTIELVLPTNYIEEATALEELADAYDARAAKILSKNLEVEMDSEGLATGGRGTAHELQVFEARTLQIEARTLRAQATSKRAAAATLGGEAPLPPGLPTLTVVPSTTSLALTWTIAPNGGPVDRQIITWTGGAPVTLLSTARAYTITGLPSNTTIAITLAPEGPGPDNPVSIFATTLPISGTPATVSYRNHTTATSDGGSVTITKPAGTVAGDVLVATLGEWGGGSLNELIPPAGQGWTAAGGASVNPSTAGVDHMRTWWKVAGASEPANYQFGANADSSTVLSLFAIQGGANSVVAALAAPNLGTGLTVAAPSLNAPSATGVLFTAYMWKSNPLGSTGRSASAAASMVERVDLGTAGGWTYLAVDTDDITAAGPTGARSVTIGGGAITAAHAVSFIVAATGSDPVVTGESSVVATPTGSTATLAITPTGTADEWLIDILGDGAPAFTVLAADLPAVKAVPRGTTASTVTVHVKAILGVEQSAEWFIGGTYTIPAQTGGGSLPARAAVTGYRNPVAGELIQNEHRTSPGWPGGSVYQMVSAEIPRGSSTIPKLFNCTADGGTQYGQTIYGNTLHLEHITIVRWGGAADIGTGNPLNGHALYWRQGIGRDITIEESAGRGGGSYSLHARKGANPGEIIWMELYDFVDLSGANAMIGPARIEDTLWDGGEKLGGGEMIIGGLSGGQHKNMEIRNWQFNRLRLQGIWEQYLTFVNCTVRTLVNNAGGQVNGINQPGGLQIVG